MSSHTWMPSCVPHWDAQDVVRFDVRCEVCGQVRTCDAYVEERTLVGKCDPDALTVATAEDTRPLHSPFTGNPPERTVRGIAGSQ